MGMETVFKHRKRVIELDKLLTEKFLKKEYCVKKKSVVKISKEVKCTEEAIKYRLIRYGLYKPRPPVLDTTNKRYGSLYVKKQNGGYCDCICDCGKRKTVIKHSLVIGTTTSCGCSRRKRKDKYWNGYGEIPGWYWNRLINNAEARKWDMNISIIEAWNLFKKQNKRCSISGIELIFSKKRDGITTASLDRINSKIGYIKENLQWVHKDVNFMKQESKEEDFLKMCKIIYEYKNLKDKFNENLKVGEKPTWE